MNSDATTVSLNCQDKSDEVSNRAAFTLLMGPTERICEGCQALAFVRIYVAILCHGSQLS